MGKLGLCSGNGGSAETAPFPTVAYTKLENESAELSVMPSSVLEGYISFSCRHCGHLQIFQGTELEMILGKSLKMAFRSHRKDQQQDNSQPSSFDQTKQNIQIPATPFQRSLEGLSIGIPVLPNVHPTAPRSTPSSTEANSPTELNQIKRIVEKPSLMKRFGKGFGSYRSDDEVYPLVSDGSAPSSVPGSQSNISLLNGAESSSSEAATLRIDELRADFSRKQDHSKKINISATEYGNVDAITSVSETNESSGVLYRKEANLRMAPWYQEGIPREIALEILSHEPIGSFMVRRSTTKMGCFALSVRVPRTFQPRGIAHYLIMRTPKGFRIKGFTKDFPTLASLIAHHSVMPELLPCPLSLSRYHPMCVISDCRKDFADIEPEPDG